MSDFYEPYIPARTFSAEALAARALLESLGVDGGKPLALARRAAGLGDGGLIETGVAGILTGRPEYTAERAARKEAQYPVKPDPAAEFIAKRPKPKANRRPRPRMDSIHAAEKPQFSQISP